MLHFASCLFHAVEKVIETNILVTLDQLFDVRNFRFDNEIPFSGQLLHIALTRPLVSSLLTFLQSRGSRDDCFTSRYFPPSTLLRFSPIDRASRLRRREHTSSLNTINGRAQKHTAVLRRVVTRSGMPRQFGDNPRGESPRGHPRFYFCARAFTVNTTGRDAVCKTSR